MGIYDRNYYRDTVPALKPWDHYSMVANLIIVNAAVMVANFALTGRDNLIVNFFSLNASHLAQPWQWYRLVTYGFAHDPSGPAHILFNMLSLYFLGQAVEDRYGRWEFLRFYLVTIIVGGVFFCCRNLVMEGSNASVLGASGGVVGVIMLYVYNYPQAQLMIWGVLPVRAWVVGIVTVLANLLGTGEVDPGSGKPVVAYDVHLVGVACASIYFFGGLDFGRMTNWKSLRRSFQNKPKLRVHKIEEEPASSRDEIEADRLLEKIYREGQNSLTHKEQQFLERYSRSVREKRGS